MPAKGLGRGLGALLGEEAAQPRQEGGVVTLPIAHVEPNLSQPRRVFDEEALGELAESIRINGLLQPIAVRRLSSGFYQIIAGERRWRAAKLAGLSSVPVVVLEADDRRTMELSLVENLQRQDLNAIEEAEGFRALIDEFGLTQEDAAARVGRSRPAVANALRLLSLPESVRDMVASGSISGGHARALLQLSSQEDITAVAETVREKGLSVRQTELYVKKLLEQEQEKPAGRGEIRLNYLEDVEKRLSSRLGRRIRIVSGRSKGRVELEFYGPDDFERLVSLLDGTPGE